MLIAALRVLAKDAVYFLAPVPELPYVAKVTPLVLGTELVHWDQPAALMTALSVDFW